MNINQSFNSEKVRKMRNLGNVYICRSPFVMSRTDAQNGLDITFNCLARVYDGDSGEASHSRRVMLAMQMFHYCNYSMP
jgi:hypothetical protein